MPDEQGNLLPGEDGYIAPVAPPSQQPTQEPPVPVPGDNLPPNQEPPADPENTDPEYIEAKSKFAELYPEWNSLTVEQQEGAEGEELRGQLSALWETFKRYEPPLQGFEDDNADKPFPTTPDVIEVPQEDVINPDAPIDPDAVPEPPEAQEPGPNPDPPKSVTDDDFKPVNPVAPETDILKAEQTVDKAGRAAGFNPFYHGDHVVHEENPDVKFVDSETFQKNKNRENR